MAADGVLPPVRSFLVGIAGPAVHMPAARRHVRALMGAYLGVTQFQLAQLLLSFGTQAQAVRQIRQARRAALLSVVLTRPACRGKRDSAPGRVQPPPTPSGPAAGANGVNGPTGRGLMLSRASDISI